MRIYIQNRTNMMIVNCFLQSGRINIAFRIAPSVLCDYGKGDLCHLPYFFFQCHFLEQRFCFLLICL